MHKSVLKKQVLEYLAVKPNTNFVDATLGLAGHAIDILANNKPKGKLLGIEADSQLCQQVLKLRIDRLIVVNDSYVNLEKIVKENDFKPVHGILLDLGLSSWHLEQSNRGFSFRKNEPLDMRYSEENDLKAEHIINEWPEKEIEKILKEYSQEQFARKIAESISEQRKKEYIKSTSQLVDIIQNSVPKWYQHRKIHFATKSFQALRIAVNDELGNLKQILPQAINILEPNGRLVAISFHSLEDRIVKNFFKEQAKQNIIKILTKKPISPSQEEININPRSRSAKLRAAQKI